MTSREKFEQALLDAYREAGKQTGYWGRRFYQKLKRVGGLRTVKEMLTPRTSAQRSGLDALLAAGRPDLTVEAIASSLQFRHLFTADELLQAEERLKGYKRRVAVLDKKREHLYPDELSSKELYPAGARRQVRVNAFERDERARKACIAAHGATCAVCSFDFGREFGRLGEGFIHVHHLAPVSTIRDAAYKLDPIKDLVPVCPNCHAMLHYRTRKPRTIKSLKLLRRNR